MRHLNNGTDHRHSKSCCDQSSPARRTIIITPSVHWDATPRTCIVHVFANYACKNCVPKEDLCVISRYLGQGQVIASHSVITCPCPIYLPLTHKAADEQFTNTKNVVGYGIYFPAVSPCRTSYEVSGSALVTSAWSISSTSWVRFDQQVVLITTCAWWSYSTPWKYFPEAIVYVFPCKSCVVIRLCSGLPTVRYQAIT